MDYLTSKRLKPTAGHDPARIEANNGGILDLNYNLLCPLVLENIEGL